MLASLLVQRQALAHTWKHSKCPKCPNFYKPLDLFCLVTCRFLALLLSWSSEKSSTPKKLDSHQDQGTGGRKPYGLVFTFKFAFVGYKMAHQDGTDLAPSHVPIGTPQASTLLERNGSPRPLRCPFLQCSSNDRCQNPSFQSYRSCPTPITSQIATKGIRIDPRSCVQRHDFQSSPPTAAEKGRCQSVRPFLWLFIFYVVHPGPVVRCILVPVVNLFFQRPCLARRPLACRAA